MLRLFWGRGENDLWEATTHRLSAVASFDWIVVLVGVHLIRNSLDYASWKERKALVAAIKPIYTATSAEAVLAELDAFEQGP